MNKALRPQPQGAPYPIEDFHVAISPYERRSFNSQQVRPRKIKFQFSPDIPKLWLRNSSIMTHFMNGLNLFLSEFEQFMVGVLKSELHTLSDPALQAQIRGLIGQEMSHSCAHRWYNQTLREQGYHIEAYLNGVHVVTEKVMERLGGKIGLATIAGFEHCTAVLAEIGLKYNMLEEAHPTMKSLWEWHAAEELEHKTLAFEFLQAIDNRYGLRVLGAILGATIVVLFSLGGMIFLTLQDPGCLRLQTLSDGVKLFLTEYKLIPRSLVRFFWYFKPDFHPAQLNTSQYAEKVFAPTSTQ